MTISQCVVLQADNRIVMQSLLFERFYRGQHASQSNIPGTGLGLAIIKEIVDLHGGTIEVQSEVNIGTTFSVWLPVGKSDELSNVEDVNGEKTAMA